MMLSLLIRPVSKQAPGSERSSRVGTYLRSVAAVLVTFIAISAADFSTKSCTCPAPVATAPGAFKRKFTSVSWKKKISCFVLFAPV